MKLIAGLGNPGAKYAGHRHNIGFMAMDRIAGDHGFPPWRAKFRGLLSEGRLGGERAALLKPETYMNESGRAVGEAMRFFKLEPEEVIVLHDELDLAPGRCKVKDGGGHAGHNGLRSIHAHIGPDYRRVRLGIGHPGHKDRVAGYVLHDFARADEAWLDDLLRGVSDGAPALAEGDAGRFMNAVALRVAPPRSGTGTAPPKARSGAPARSAAAARSAGTGPTPRQASRENPGEAMGDDPGRPADGAAAADGEGGGRGERPLPRRGCRARPPIGPPAPRRPLPMSAADAFEVQAENCARLGSPFTARVLRAVPGLLDPATPLGRRILDWPGEIGPSGASVPLRLVGGLHALALSGAPLAAAYPPHEPDDAALGAALARALAEHADHLHAWLDGPPQTNEVRRSAALIPAACLLAARHGLPLALSEVGASAGLNLHFDRYALETPGFRRGPAEPALTLSPGWEGPPPPDAWPEVAERAACDVAPLDPSRPADLLRLRAYLWPDQPHRRALTDAAARVATTRVERADAVAWLRRRLAEPRPGRLHLILHTVAWQYLPAGAQAEGEAVIAEAGGRATLDAPIAHLAMESDGGPDAALTLATWPGGGAEALGRADFHGRRIAWRPPRQV